MPKHRHEPPIPITAHTPLGRTRAFRDAAHQFVECVAFGAWRVGPHARGAPGSAHPHAPTFLEESDDPSADFVDLTALARAGVPVRLSCGAQSPPAFRDVGPVRHR